MNKSPEKIKKDAETCMNHPSHMVCNYCNLFSECGGIAEHIIKELYDLVLQLESRLAQAERERDALYFDITNMPNACDVCAHGVQNDGDCDELFGHNNGCEFKWRGVCDGENTKEDAE